MFAMSSKTGLKRAALSVRRFSSTGPVAEASPAAFDQGHYAVIGACYVGAFLWAYRDSLEVDGVMVQVPKAKLDKMQTELSSIKKLLGQ